ncbi:2-amino-4-hydroxy-6-hydroxymethyldihydropteridine diphosphokinase [Lacticaseibacillus absianus]|uniref:2-amino-4-hydroxy-6- hydroxymethyldihydropteridine diphosphokinase n=1 Tax=Lacticaseibacillus absianus TaxID=2729623 RepID=UPI0015CE51AA|nr:2-amino-4-hydroxy-6-hydroxymethyldihydropteridine diphosphokinase [Lacticaseibacillus absianus]
MTEAYVALGSNLGARLATLQAARVALQALPGLSGLRASRVYETEPVGGVPQGDFLNQVVRFDTTQRADALLQQLQAIERAQHRERLVHWGPRTLDLDLLYYGHLVMATPQLTLPHPEIGKRRFVLEPLLEVAHGSLRAQVHHLLATTPDTHWVRPYTEDKG